jgi:hypothetical protein
MGRRVAGAQMKLEIGFRCQIAHEFLVQIGFSAANSVMEVGDGKHQPQLRAQLQKNAEKRDGIRPAGNGHSHVVACLKQAVASDVGADAVDHIEILSGSRQAASPMCIGLWSRDRVTCIYKGTTMVYTAYNGVDGEV